MPWHVFSSGGAQNARIEAKLCFANEATRDGDRARKERPHGLSGGVGGVLGMGKRQLNIKQDSNHATNFEPCGSRRQNFKRNSAPLSAPLARWVERSGAGGEKGKTKDPRQLPRAFCFEFPQQF